MLLIFWMKAIFYNKTGATHLQPQHRRCSILGRFYNVEEHIVVLKNELG
jgi:hypothetical protein